MKWSSSTAAQEAAERTGGNMRKICCHASEALLRDLSMEGDSPALREGGGLVTRLFLLNQVASAEQLTYRAKIANVARRRCSPSDLKMVKQIKEQVEILAEHVNHDDFNIEFLSLHAQHLAQLAALLAKEQLCETSKRQIEFLRLITR